MTGEDVGLRVTLREGEELIITTEVEGPDGSVVEELIRIECVPIQRTTRVGVRVTAPPEYTIKRVTKVGT